MYKPHYNRYPLIFYVGYHIIVASKNVWLLLKTIPSSISQSSLRYNHVPFVDSRDWYPSYRTHSPCSLLMVACIFESNLSSIFMSQFGVRPITISWWSSSEQQLKISIKRRTYKTSGWSAFTTEKIFNLSFTDSSPEFGLRRFATMYDSPILRRKLSLKMSGLVSLTNAPYPIPRSFIL